MERVLAHDLNIGERTTDVQLKDVAPFGQWLLKPEVKKGLEASGFRIPTVIQASAIPVGKSGMDLLIRSKSGTGKTLIFCIVLLETCYDVPGLHSIIVAPTREIAIQIEMVLSKLGQFCKNFQVINVIGGTDITIDRKNLQKARVVVGTPGRLVHLIQSDILKTSNIRLVVLDEADQLFSSSHRKNLEIILRALPSQRQILACSATFCNNLDVELAKVMRNPLLISTKDRITALLGIKQYVHELPEEKTSVLEMEAKVKAMTDIFRRVAFKLCIIFAGSQSRAESYSNYLSNSDWDCELISGAQKQVKRCEIFKKFQNFQTRILISTDLMARGVDSEHVNLVINVEPPRDMVTYLHRIGRAGRFGSHGISITIISSENERNSFKKILGEIGCGVNACEFPKCAVDGENENFWDPSSFKMELQQQTETESEESCVAVLREKTNLPLVQNEERKSINIDGIDGISYASIDTNTFCVDSKDSAVNILPANVIDNKENLLIIHAEDTPTSNRSSVQLSANTIDDASSIAADSVFSSQLELCAPHPSLALDLPQGLNYCNYESTEIRDAKREQVLQTDLFMDYCANVLRNVDEDIPCTTDNLESSGKPPEVEDVGKRTLAAYRDDIFSDYTSFMKAENGELEDDTKIEQEKYTGEKISNEKNLSLQEGLSSLIINAEMKIDTNIVDHKIQSAVLSDGRSDSQTGLQNTICATNGSYSADCESSTEIGTNDDLMGVIASEKEYSFENQELIIDETREDGNEASPINDMWMKEYWRQVNFIEVYVKFALDYHRQWHNHING